MYKEPLKISLLSPKKDKTKPRKDHPSKI